MFKNPFSKQSKIQRNHDEVLNTLCRTAADLAIDGLSASTESLIQGHPKAYLSASKTGLSTINGKTGEKSEQEYVIMTVVAPVVDGNIPDHTVYTDKFGKDMEGKAKWLDLLFKTGSAQQ